MRQLRLFCALAVAIFTLMIGELAAQQDQAAPDASPTMYGNALWETLQKGGRVMYVILGASIVGFAFILESAFKTRRAAILPGDLESHLVEHQGMAAAEKVVADQRECAAQRIVRAGLHWRHGTSEQIQDAIEEAVDEEVWQMRRSIRPVGIIANTTPLLGLLGTVVGIIQAFEVVAEKGALGDPGLLAGGISKALLTTCFGLIVAIPLLLTYHYLLGRMENRLRRCEALAKENLIIPPEELAAADAPPAPAEPAPVPATEVTP